MPSVSSPLNVVGKIQRSVAAVSFPYLTTMKENVYAPAGMWITTTAGLVIGMISVGGITRLTQSGLSMTDWKPLGSLPPMTTSEWETEFSRYKTFPEWEQRKSMTLSEFKYIYAWEYGHRMMGRFIGLAFVGPWIYLSVRKQIPPGYQGRLAILGGLGLTQGLVGWWMVKSGLGEDRRGDKKEIRVQPTRLATHLTMAVVTYGGLLWTALDIFSLPHNQQLSKSAAFVEQFQNAYKMHATKVLEGLRKVNRIRVGGIALTGLTTATIISGALVAGNDAGRAYNTFPTMDGEWLPSGLYEQQPWHSNLINNTTTVQWNHRVLATTTALTAYGVVVAGLFHRPIKQFLTPQALRGLTALCVATAGQYTLGVVTLVSYVPISLAAAHQVGSIAVFSSALYVVHTLRYARPAAVQAAKKLLH